MTARVLLAALVLAVSGCASDDDDAVFCADAPVTTWDNFGAGFITENCRSCHHPDAEDRQGAPDDVNFVDEQDVVGRRTLVLAMAAGPNPSMPPGGGTDGDDRYLLEVWLRCWVDEG